MNNSIIRFNKIKAPVQAAKTTAHDYRQTEVTQTNQTVIPSSEELVNANEHNYWKLANARIEAAGIAPPRTHKIRCVEATLTASPELFKRDSNGCAVEYSQSDWLKDVRTFLIEKFEEQNLIAFQIHEHGKSPYLHAVIVPITDNGKLSAQKMFSPAALRGYRREYAELMKRCER